MSIEILMPALSPTMTEGNLVKWLIKKGDKVKAGDILAEIETDKATMELETVDEGTITEILVKEGTKAIKVNTPIAILNGLEKDDKEILIAKDNIKEVELKKNENIKPENISKNKYEKLKKKEKDQNIIASPYVKKLSKDNNFNLNSIIGTGPNRRIIKRDINNQLDQENKLITSSAYTSYEPSSMRKIISERTTKTKNSVPHFYLTIESQVDKLLDLRKTINDKNLKNKISINDILVKTLAISQSKNPKTNVSWFNGKIIQYSTVDVSIAVALKDGLITPIIKNADKKGLLEISKEIKELAKKAKDGKLKPEEYNGGTISISNLGMYGITEFEAIINPPQSSILAVGTILRKPYVINNQIQIVNILKSTLSADHRVLDGAVAAKLLKDFNDLIENPFEVWLESKDMEII